MVSVVVEALPLDHHPLAKQAAEMEMWVQQAIRDIDCEIYNQEDYRHVQHKPMDDRVVSLGNAYHHELADARSSEYGLNDHGAAEQITCAGSQHGDHRQ